MRRGLGSIADRHQSQECVIFGKILVTSSKVERGGAGSGQRSGDEVVKEEQGHRTPSSETAIVVALLSTGVDLAQDNKVSGDERSQAIDHDDTDSIGNDEDDLLACQLRKDPADGL